VEFGLGCSHRNPRRALTGEGEYSEVSLSWGGGKGPTERRERKRKKNLRGKRGSCELRPALFKDRVETVSISRKPPL